MGGLGGGLGEVWGRSGGGSGGEIQEQPHCLTSTHSPE